MTSNKIRVKRQPDGTWFSFGRWSNLWGDYAATVVYQGEDAKILDRLFNKGEFKK